MDAARGENYHRAATAIRRWGAGSAPWPRRSSAPSRVTAARRGCRCSARSAAGDAGAPGRLPMLGTLAGEGGAPGLPMDGVDPGCAGSPGRLPMLGTVAVAPARRDCRCWAPSRGAVGTLSGRIGVDV